MNKKLDVTLHAGHVAEIAFPVESPASLLFVVNAERPIDVILMDAENRKAYLGGETFLGAVELRDQKLLIERFELKKLGNWVMLFENKSASALRLLAQLELTTS